MDENRKGRVHEKYVDELYKYNQSCEIDTGRRREIDVEPTAYYTNKICILDDDLYKEMNQRDLGIV